MISRRHLLQIAAAAQLSPLLDSAEAAFPSLKLAEAQPFSYASLKALVADMAMKPYVPAPAPDPQILKAIDYDAARNLTFNLDLALYGRGSGPYPVIFLTTGQYFPRTVRMHVIQGDEAREILFRHYYFHHSANDPLLKLPEEPSPLAGLEINQAYDKPELRDHEGWARFVGASYFRAVGESNQYGLSARAVAQNTGGAGAEEFPDFTNFWIEGGARESDPVHLYALLDGPSIVGAYRFILHREAGVTMEITCDLHFRKSIERLGIAPLTSMYWFSETLKPFAIDWRPEVHDSDGVAIWTSTGEHLWRPLNNPKHLMISTFPDDSPRGFGLMQRDHIYDHYLDDVYYDRRPSAWIEPIGKWGPGSVQLVEIATDNETYDNIVVFWVPKAPALAGQSAEYKYRLLWRDKDPHPGPLALCMATRLGQGAPEGSRRSKTLRKFELDFQGPILKTLDIDATLDIVLTTSRGLFVNLNTNAAPNGDDSLWRASFDLAVDGTDPVDMRCVLKFKGRTLTETWVYQYHPFVTA